MILWSNYICIMHRADIDRYQLQLNFTGYVDRTGVSKRQYLFSIAGNSFAIFMCTHPYVYVYDFIIYIIMYIYYLFYYCHLRGKRTKNLLIPRPSKLSRNGTCYTLIGIIKF